MVKIRAGVLTVFLEILLPLFYLVFRSVCPPYHGAFRGFCGPFSAPPLVRMISRYQEAEAAGRLQSGYASRFFPSLSNKWQTLPENVKRILLPLVKDSL